MALSPKAREYEAHRQQMNALRRTFKRAFGISLTVPVFAALTLALKLLSYVNDNVTVTASFAVTLISFGVGIIEFCLISLSREMTRYATCAAAVGAAVYGALNLSDRAATVAGILALAAQLICLVKYRELEFLQRQEGYPDFHPLHKDNESGRILTDEEIREQWKQNKEGFRELEHISASGEELPPREKSVLTSHMENITDSDRANAAAAAGHAPLYFIPDKERTPANTVNDIEALEEKMAENCISMHKINKLFTAAYYVSSAVPALAFIYSLAMLASIIMTMGNTDMSGFFPIIMAVMSAGLCFINGMAEQKNLRCVIISATAQTLLFVFVTSDTPRIFSLTGLCSMAFFAGAVLQIICLTRFKTIAWLEMQPGYPDFNPIFFHDTVNKRISTDRQIISRTRENRSAVMESADISSSGAEPVKSAGGAVMEDITEFTQPDETSGLMNNKRNRSYEMEDISSDENKGQLK